MFSDISKAGKKNRFLRLCFSLVGYHEAEPGPMSRRNQERGFWQNTRRKYIEVGGMPTWKGIVEDVGGMKALGNSGYPGLGSVNYLTITE